LVVDDPAEELADDREVTVMLDDWPARDRVNEAVAR
jgi:hypothetical protein